MTVCQSAETPSLPLSPNFREGETPAVPALRMLVLVVIGSAGASPSLTVCTVKTPRADDRHSLFDPNWTDRVGNRQLRKLRRERKDSAT